jgi:hypothetical protein
MVQARKMGPALINKYQHGGRYMQYITNMKN